MPLSRDVVVPGMISAYEEFGELLGQLTDTEWEVPTRCAGWRVADVAAHVVGQLSDVVSLRLDGLGTPEATQREVDERRGRGRAELIEELVQSTKLGADLAASFDDAAWEGPVPGGGNGTLGFGVEALWFDTVIHADDIRSALGTAPALGTDGLRVSLSHIAQLLSDDASAPATLRFDGLGEFAVSGGGTVVSGDATAFVLGATGRGDLAAIGLDESMNIYRG